MTTLFSLQGRKSSPNCTISSECECRIRRKAYFEYFPRLAVLLAATDPASNILDVGGGGGDHDKSDARPAQLHTRDNNLKGASSRFVENMDLSGY